ncbi:MAG: hypothetical protein ACI8SA_002106, partial [Dokdonia sp.]
MKNVLIQIFLHVFFIGSVCSQNLKINEIMPSNGMTSFDSFGESSDWVEVYNNSSNTMQLSNYYLSNNFSDKLKWQLPVINLPAQSWVLVYCSG